LVKLQENKTDNYFIKDRGKSFMKKGYFTNRSWNWIGNSRWPYERNPC